LAFLKGSENLMRNENLRSALLKEFRHQYDAAEALHIEYSRLSGIIGGYRKPTKREWKELRRVLGKEKFKAVFVRKTINSIRR
jgi:hypothetical protein